MIIWILLGFGVVAIIAIHFYINWRIRTGIRSKQREQQVELNDFAIAMSRSSVDIFILDVENRTSTPIKTSGVLRGMNERVSRPYEKTWEHYVTKYVHPNDRARVMSFIQVRHILRLLQTSVDCACNYRIVINGQTMNYQALFTFLGDHRNRKIVFDFRCVDDIVEAEQRRNAQLEEANARTLKANKARTDALLKLTRDIRTPMNTIIGFTNLLEKNMSDPERSANYLSKIRMAGDTLISIFDSVQEKANIESGMTLVNGNSLGASLKPEGKRILLAEDNDLNAEIAMAILSDAGFDVDRAADGMLCVDMLESAAPDYYDLVLMDVQMPNMNGYDATRKIRKMEDLRKSSIPVIAMTASALAEDKQDALEAGMDGHLSKPIDMPRLMETLAHYLNDE